jgi:hypothetical protein
LIVDIGTAIDRSVSSAFVRAALPMMRQPARLAGLSALHDFLERGFAAFRRMGGADLRHDQRTRNATSGSDADGANDPFPDPMTGQITQSSSARM